MSEPLTPKSADGHFAEWDFGASATPDEGFDDPFFSPRPPADAPPTPRRAEADPQPGGAKPHAPAARPVPSHHLPPAASGPAPEALLDAFDLGESIVDPYEGGATSSPRSFAPAARPTGANKNDTSAGSYGTAPVKDASSGPKLGDTICGFRLISELGRGAFARVYLAEQIGLGNRRVALKVSKAEGEEPQMLARLQHSHIVPIHSVLDDPSTGLRLLCMPYLGGANLAQVLDAVGGHSKAAVGRKRSLVDALDEVSQWLRSRSGAESFGGTGRPSRFPHGSVPPDGLIAPAQAAAAAAGERDEASDPALASRAGSLRRLHSLWDRLHWRGKTQAPGVSLEQRDFDQPARIFLRAANSIQGGVWILARLAEGLEHAHSRGLLHRDLKPSNVLITSDGTPMLLDFNLSTAATFDDPEGGEKAMLGGTLPYMSPEHLDAFDPNGKTEPEAVRERSDIYALGLILFETIAGRHPFPEPPPGMPLLQVIKFMHGQRQTVPSLRAVNPAVSPGLDSIVAKCLAPDPERRYARARDFAEDLNRFLADQPLQYAPEKSLRERLAKWTRRNPRVCGAGSVAVFSATLVIMMAALIAVLASSMQTVHARLKLQAFRTDLAECRFLLNMSGGPKEHLGKGVALAEKALTEQGLGLDGTPREESWVHRLTPGDQTAVRKETTELILMEARARVELASRDGSEGDRRDALVWAVRWLDAAEHYDPTPPAPLYGERARYHAALGQADLAARDRTLEAGRELVSARDFTLRGVSRLSHGDVFGAEADLIRAVDIDSKSFWAWFALGHCRFEQKRFLEAAGDFAACVALEPRFSWPYMNRGLALAVAGRLDEARHSLEHAVDVSPRFAEGWLNLALTQLEQGDPAAAEHSLGRAMALGLDGPSVRVAWAETKARRSSPAEAESLFANLIKANPDDLALRTARGVFRAGAGADPAGARADLSEVLSDDPGNARAHYGLGMVVRVNSPAEALAHADAAIKADPNMLDAYQLRALVRARTGDLAAVDDVERFCQSPNRHRFYNAACALAILVKTADQPRLAGRAVAALDRALDAGFPAARAAVDPDFEAVRTLGSFRETLTRHGLAADSIPAPR